MAKKNDTSNKRLIGWKEWCSLPHLGVFLIKAKIDTGAKTSALHAKGFKVFKQNGEDYLEFTILPHRSGDHGAVLTRAKLADYRYVMSSNGYREKRFVIETNIIIGSLQFTAEITLTDRTLLNYPMLIGRGALQKLFLIDASKAHVQKKPQLPSINLS